MRIDRFLEGAPADRRATGRLPIRYEDIAQDGRLRLEACAPALGVVWPVYLGQVPFSRSDAAAAVIPILVRLAIRGGDGAGGDGPVGVGLAFDVAGAFRIAHTPAAGAEPRRLVLDMNATVTGKRGRTYGPRPEGAGEPIVIGELFARHVYTRLFAPPDQRRVERLDPPLDALGDEAVEAAPIVAIAALPEGAEPLDEPALDELPIAFGLAHTDSNQHVNSLVYPRMLEEAALRRFAARGLSTTVLAREVDVGFRKPFFAGDRARIRLQAYRDPAAGGRIGVVGTFAPEGATDPSRAHAFVRMSFG